MDKLRKDYYAILHVPKESTFDQIRERYYFLAKLFHIDKGRFSSPEEKAIAEYILNK